MEQRPERGLWVFAAVAGVLFLLRIGMAYTSLPVETAAAISLLATVIFVAAPILALFAAARFSWTTPHALLFLVVGVVAHAGGYLLAEKVLGGRGLAAVVLLALAQTGLMFWCLGLGALVAQRITDRNLLLPIALFLAGFDMFLVFSPTGPTKVLVQQRPEVFEAVAMSVPRVATPQEAVGAVQAMAYVGPADLFFLAMFFIALFKFRMRTRETLLAVIPVLVAYLAVVLFLGSVRIGNVSLAMLPALLPIGATVLLVNAREFRLTTQEKVATAIVGLLAVGMALLGLALASRQRPTTQPAPSPKVGVPVPAEPPDSSAPAGRGL